MSKVESQFDPPKVKVEGSLYNPTNMSDEEYLAYLDKIQKRKIKTTYVEALVPSVLEDEIYALIDAYIVQRGYNLDEI